MTKKIFILAVMTLLSVNMLGGKSGLNYQEFFEDFSIDNGEWTEYDPINKIELDYTYDQRLEFNHWIRYEPGYVYREYPVQDFVLEYDINITNHGGNGRIIGPGFSDTLGSLTETQNGIFGVFYAGWPGGGGVPHLDLCIFENGIQTLDWTLFLDFLISKNKTYYVRLEKFGDQVTISIFLDAARINHITGSPKTFTTNLVTTTFNYFYAVNGYLTIPHANWEWTTGWLDNIYVKTEQQVVDFLISGTVTDGTNPIKGVTITFSHNGHTETTDVNGNYSYTVDYGTTTTVTPGKTGYGSWSPPNRTFNNITSNQTQNFTGSLNNFTISGTVTDGTNPIKGVTITFSHDGHKETTDVNGNYSYTVAYGTTTTVTPRKTGYGSWKPARKTFKNITSDKTQNFKGSLDTCTISGTVTDGTNPIAGVTITFSHNGHKETTDSYGHYSYTVEYGTSTTVTASKPGYTFTPSEYSFTNLTKDKPNQDFTALNYISVTITNPNDGGTVSGAVIITASVSSNNSNTAAASILSVTGVEFYIDGELEKQDASSPYQYRWDTTLVANGSHTIKAKALHSSGLSSEHEITVHVNNSTEPPHIELNRTRLNFGAVIGESRTGAQTFLIENSGGCCLNWTAAVSDTWINITPLNGTTNMLVTVSVDVTGLAKGRYSGTVSITDANADNSPASVDIFLEVLEKAQEMSPFGSFDSPLDGSVVTGSIPVTGWALDDVEVSNVKIFRNPIEGHEIGLIYIGDALFVEGARPDVELQFPTYPKNYQAGWGYMMLTNMLPNQGNGTFVLTAIAADSSGHEVVLGKKTITCDNEHAVKPFGAIDTPGQGGDASGMHFVNFGWALTPQPNTIPMDGSTIKVWIDGVPLAGHPVYNQYREDIATLFPGYNNSDGAVGYYYLDTTLYANGVHTIAWSVKDDAGNSDGIGSRFFRILNMVNKTNVQTSYKYNFVDGVNMNPSLAPVYLKRGYFDDFAPQILYPDKKGMIHIEIKEDERIEIGLRDPGTGSTRYFGYLSIGQKLRRLPIGSFLDSSNGIFYWQPGPGYIGMYKLVFIEKNPKGKTSKRQMRITITPKFK
jgi:hypothetical protein